MNITEFLEGTGVWKVPVEELPDEKLFIRDEDKNGKEQPLLHVCEREILTKENGQFFACITGRTFWNWFHGRYECMECKCEFNTDEELVAVWEDGKGTGVEGTA
jgi:hypothetical protein